MTRPAPEWLEWQWAAKRAWHAQQVAQSMRSKVAAVIALQHRQQIVNQGKVALGLPPIPMRVWGDAAMTPEAIQRIRKALSEDTVTFGQRFGRSGRTVEAWEQGKRNPDPLVLKEIQRIIKARKLSLTAVR